MRRPTLLASAALAAALLPGAFARPAAAQEQTQVHNTAPLHPPKGARVAIVEFYDLECPDCARASPLLREAAEKYKIPLVRHDFPLPFHAWSFDAAVNARWFDTHSKKLGDQYRDAVFAAQPTITSPADLRAFTEKFAAQNKLTLPFVIDPQGKLAALVKADAALGQRVGIEHTPTIWVTTNRGGGAPPFVEIVDRDKLYQVIDEALAQTAPAGSRSGGPARP